MVPGGAGSHGMESVPGAVEEELRPGGESVTVQPRLTVGGAVLVLPLRRGAATLSPAVSQVMIMETVAESEDL